MSPVVTAPQNPQEAIQAIHALLMNLQPHIAQSCLPGHAVFIDNYVTPCMEICERFRAIPTVSKEAERLDPEQIYKFIQDPKCGYTAAARDVISALSKEIQRLQALGGNQTGLVWTREKPTMGGHYWYHQDGVAEAAITEVYPAFGRFLMFEGDGSSIDLIEGAKWAGPIPEPTPTDTKGTT